MIVELNTYYTTQSKMIRMDGILKIRRKKK